MATARNTIQRQTILEEMRKVFTHPTADEIFQMVQARNPKIGRATVYRNLDHLEKEGEILKLQTKTGKARYDGHAKPHCHLVCKKCNCVIDVFDISLSNLESKEVRSSGFEIKASSLEIPGICKSCRSKS